MKIKKCKKKLCLGTIAVVLVFIAIGYYYWTRQTSPEPLPIDGSYYVWSNEPEALALGYISNAEIDGLTDFQLIKDASEIPFEKGDFKNPSQYKETVISPVVEDEDDGARLFTCYTWSEQAGMLTKWTFKIGNCSINCQISHVLAEVIDTGIGNFVPATEGFVPAPGMVLLNTVPPTPQRLPNLD